MENTEITNAVGRWLASQPLLVPNSVASTYDTDVKLLPAHQSPSYQQVAGLHASRDENDAVVVTVVAADNSQGMARTLRFRNRLRLLHALPAGVLIALSPLLLLLTDLALEPLLLSGLVLLLAPGGGALFYVVSGRLERYQETTLSRDTRQLPANIIYLAISQPTWNALTNQQRILIQRECVSSGTGLLLIRKDGSISRSHEPGRRPTPRRIGSYLTCYEGGDAIRARL